MVRSPRSPSQCLGSMMGVVIITMSKGHTRLRVPVVPLCSDTKNRGTASLQHSGADRSPNGRTKLVLIRLFYNEENTLQIS